MWKLLIVFLSFACATTHIGLAWWYFVKTTEEFGGSSSYLTQFETSQPLFYVVAGSLVFLGDTVMADLVASWRCYVLLEKRLLFIIPLVLATIAGGILNLMALSARIDNVKNPTRFRISKRFIAFSTPYLSLSLGATLYNSLLISLRLLTLTNNGLKSTKLYKITKKQGVIIVESLLIYSIPYIIIVAYLTQGSFFYVYAQNVLPHAAGLASTLVILRTTMLDENLPDAPLAGNIYHDTAEVEAVRDFSLEKKHSL
ncbi:hypothetical protein M422DRAFT_71465 [Sphaerobolus stellatus SS14]|uniref:Unplaced genomic scaffold SPHSTscaffold_238, whole genome shotgun sequence n=1 Tax=Sphaerobolus stellatus (strain SS14) TaxID=990650 RepID=A0A0C9U230_SPHS4|nr:hypothetical protein M422DRAFT_71465 [Sphaerobolus stellatus SS14]